jgi:hypothetical protein
MSTTTFANSMGAHRSHRRPTNDAATARSYDAQLNATAELLETYAPAEGRNHFANSGYGVV